MVFTGLLISLVCISNFTALMIAYPVGVLTQDFIVTTRTISAHSHGLTPYFTIHLPKVCDNSTALALGVILGVYASSKDRKIMKNFAKKGSALVNLFLSKIFTPVLPIFILGFILKAQHDGLLSVLFKNFVPLLSVIVTLYACYIGFLYMLVKGFRLKKALSALKNILPATIIGFSSMSSAAAMPILIDGASKNAKDKELPKRIVPFITNTHMMGDALAIPLMAMSLYIVEYGHVPSADKYLIFAIGYVLAKFASAGIPGETILIMTPVLESKLGFTSEMSSIILTTYLLFDPFCTLGSIFGNGAFSMAFEKLKNLALPRRVVSAEEL